MSALSVLYEDNHLLAVDKPAGVPTQPDASGDASLVDIARNYIGVRCAKPGRVYLVPVHRLDRPVSGALLFARTGKAASRLAEQFRARDGGGPEKIYDAVVELHRPPPPADVELRLDHDLEILAAGGVRVASAMHNTHKVRRASITLRLRAAWTAAAPFGARAWLEVRLLTGVKHQIRAQLAWSGWPVAGDFRYGPEGRPARPAPIAGGRAIALHARRLTVLHPTRQAPAVFEAPHPPHWAGVLAFQRENSR